MSTTQALPPPRIMVETFANPQVKKYHVSRDIASNRMPFEGFYPLMTGIPSWKSLGDTGQTIVTEAINIHGVTSVMIEPYYLRVIIDEAFDWEPIHDRIMALLREKAFTEEERQNLEEKTMKQYDPGLR